MPIGEYVRVFFTQLAFYIPLMIVWLIGLILAIVTWKQHPKASLLALRAFVIFLINILLSTANSLLPLYLHNNANMSSASISTISMIAGIVIQIISVAAWILIIVAIFSRRKAIDSQSI